MNSQTSEIIDLLIDLQKIEKRFSSISRKMTSSKAARLIVPDVESSLYEAAGSLSELILACCIK